MCHEGYTQVWKLKKKTTLKRFTLRRDMSSVKKKKKKPKTFAFGKQNAIFYALFLCYNFMKSL